MPQRLTDSRLANIGAGAIHEGFRAYHAGFREITGRAADRFAQRDWHGLRADAVERMELYQKSVGLVVDHIRDLFADRVKDTVVWASMKAVYSGQIGHRNDWELAETLFNSCTRRVFATVGRNPRIEFVDSDFEKPPTQAATPIYATYHRARTSGALMKTILSGYRFSLPFEDLGRDADRLGDMIDERLSGIGELPFLERVEMLRSVFYRGPRAYLLGRVFSGLHVLPLVIALENGPNGVRVDALLLRENDVSILFSFARSYFHVDVERPYDLTRFLRTLLPRKRLAELYMAIGCKKHGKTELYRDLLRHLRQSDAKFQHAPGTRGMVMIAFAMPGHDLVFKVIRDRFPHPKSISREGIKAKYRLVARHDRVGRLVDAQEFDNLKISRSRFAQALLTDLHDEAPGTASVGDQDVVFSHVYVERRVIPLNVYIRQAGEEAARLAISDYGMAIKDLACTNIFPGDLLLKNFGVTRNGRVVFYDYDELTLLTECSFRRLPEPRTYEEALAAEPWFTVAKNDIFPEEFRTFLGLRGEQRRVFEEHHSDLYDSDSWQGIQRRLRAGEAIEVLPYGEDSRLGGR